MKFVSSREDYEIYDTRVQSLIDKRKYLPENVFRKHLGYFQFIDFSNLFMSSFFLKMMEFIEVIGDRELSYSVVDPDPQTYFFRHFGSYSIMLLTEEDSEETFISGVNDYPKANPADSMITRARCVLLSSSGGDWAVYGDYEFEIAICAFTTKDLMKKFKSIHDDEYFFDDVNEAADHAYLYRNDGSDKAVFCKNLQYRIPKS